MPVTHVFMMRDSEVIAQVLHYLEHGHFDRHGGEGEPGPDTVKTP